MIEAELIKQAQSNYVSGIAAKYTEYLDDLNTIYIALKNADKRIDFVQGKTRKIYISYRDYYFKQHMIDISLFLSFSAISTFDDVQIIEKICGVLKNQVPSSVAAGVLYYRAKAYGLTQKIIIITTGLSEPTVRKFYRKIKDILEDWDDE